jgi:hypothetical protein
VFEKINLLSGKCAVAVGWRVVVLIAAQRIMASDMAGSRL